MACWIMEASRRSLIESTVELTQPMAPRGLQKHRKGRTAWIQILGVKSSSAESQWIHRKRLADYRELVLKTNVLGRSRI